MINNRRSITVVINDINNRIIEMISMIATYLSSLQWRHNGRDGVSDYQPIDCLLNHLFRRRSKKTSKLRVTGHCAGNSPVTGEFRTQKASNAENVPIWWRHHDVNDNQDPNISLKISSQSDNLYSLVTLWHGNAFCITTPYLAYPYLAYEGNPLVTAHKRAIIMERWYFFGVSLNKLFNKLPSWFETLWPSCRCNVTLLYMNRPNE